MTQGPGYSVPFRRRREFKTDYRHRLKLLSSTLPRAIVRKSLKQVAVQIAEYDPRGDKIMVSAFSKELKNYGWDKSTSTTPAAYLVGYLAAKKALAKGVSKAVLDIGLNNPSKGCKIFGALKGMLDGGLNIPHNPKILPPEERIKGSHLGDDVVEKFEAVKSKLEETEWMARKK